MLSEALPLKLFAEICVSWTCLRLYATSWKVAVSMSYLSSRTMALRFIQPITEMSTRELPGTAGWPKFKAEIISILQEYGLPRSTSGGRSVGIVRSRTKSHGVCLSLFDGLPRSV
jgi:hypothetical protein